VDTFPEDETERENFSKYATRNTLAGVYRMAAHGKTVSLMTQTERVQNRTKHSRVYTAVSVSFPEPTCLLVSAKTRSLPVLALTKRNAGSVNEIAVVSTKGVLQERARNEPGEFENGDFTLKTRQMFSFRFQIPSGVNLDLCLRKTRLGNHITLSFSIKAGF